MSRNTQHEFVSMDADALIATLVSAYEKIVGVTVMPSSPEKLFVQWVANVLLYERSHTNKAGNSNLPSRAEGDDLNEIGDTIFNFKRPDAEPSTTTMRFRIQQALTFDVLIPKGSRVTDASQTLYWATDKDVYIVAGNTSADVECTCQTAGSQTNGYVTGQINNLVDVFSYYYSCENLTESDGGTDAPSDDDYYALMKESINSWSDAGARGGYVYFAKTVSTLIGDVVAKSPDPGYVKIYILMKDGSFASEEVKKAVLAVCNEDYTRPLTDHVSADDGHTVTFNVNFKYFIPSDSGKSASQMEKDVQAAVDEYISWQCAKFGRDINPDKLRHLVLACGIKRLEVTEPVFTVVDNGLTEDHSVPEVAKKGTVTIVSGGYEDE